MFRKLLLTTALLAAAAPALAERVTVNLSSITTPILPTAVLAGDREFGGNGPRMTLDTVLVPTAGGRSIVAQVTFRAEETGGDGSFTRIGPLSFEVWRATGAERVESIVGNPNARMVWLSTPGCVWPCSQLGPTEDGGSIMTITAGPGTYLSEVTFLGDTAGDDISDDGNPHGDTSIRAIRFHPVTIETVD
ncbi:hypothetical protein HKCCE2091_17580 [Rhodobacterales bacterium HKCCE2091]|nr:hypothetical protein [Rhodobacterales bacterium HKCCE2091]